VPPAIPARSSLCAIVIRAFKRLPVMKPIHRDQLVAASILLSSATTAYAHGCHPLPFKPGQSAVTVSGVSPVSDDDVVCYTFNAAENQSADVLVDSEEKIVLFSIRDVVDIQQTYRFITHARSYEIIMVSPRPYSGVDFSLTVSLHARTGKNR
jgi:hypothetical protein